MRKESEASAASTNQKRPRRTSAPPDSPSGFPTVQPSHIQLAGHDRRSPANEARSSPDSASASSDNAGGVMDLNASIAGAGRSAVGNERPSTKNNEKLVVSPSGSLQQTNGAAPAAAHGASDASGNRIGANGTGTATESSSKLSARLSPMATANSINFGTNALTSILAAKRPAAMDDLKIKLASLEQQLAQTSASGPTLPHVGIPMLGTSSMAVAGMHHGMGVNNSVLPNNNAGDGVILPADSDCISRPSDNVTGAGIGPSLNEGNGNSQGNDKSSNKITKKMKGRQSKSPASTPTSTTAAAASKPASASPKTKPSRGKPRASDVPRRPLSAYNIFFSEQRELILREINAKERGEVFDLSKQPPTEELLKPLMKTTRVKRPHRKVHGKIGLVEMARKVGKRWSTLGEQERKKYYALAAKDKERQEKAMDDYEKKMKREAEQKQQLEEQDMQRQMQIQQQREEQQLTQRMIDQRQTMMNLKPFQQTDMSGSRMSNAASQNHPTQSRPPDIQQLGFDRIQQQQMQQQLSFQSNGLSTAMNQNGTDASSSTFGGVDDQHMQQQQQQQQQLLEMLRRQQQQQSMNGGLHFGSDSLASLSFQNGLPNNSHSNIGPSSQFANGGLQLGLSDTSSDAHVAQTQTNNRFSSLFGSNGTGAGSAPLAGFPGMSDLHIMQHIQNQHNASSAFSTLQTGLGANGASGNSMDPHQASIFMSQLGASASQMGPGSIPAFGMGMANTTVVSTSGIGDTGSGSMASPSNGGPAATMNGSFLPGMGMNMGMNMNMNMNMNGALSAAGFGGINGSLGLSNIQGFNGMTGMNDGTFAATFQQQQQQQQQPTASASSFPPITNGNGNLAPSSSSNGMGSPDVGLGGNLGNPFGSLM